MFASPSLPTTPHLPLAAFRQAAKLGDAVKGKLGDVASAAQAAGDKVRVLLGVCRWPSSLRRRWPEPASLTLFKPPHPLVLPRKALARAAEDAAKPQAALKDALKGGSPAAIKSAQDAAKKAADALKDAASKAGSSPAAKAAADAAKAAAAGLDDMLKGAEAEVRRLRVSEAALRMGRDCCVGIYRRGGHWSPCRQA